MLIKKLKLTSFVSLKALLHLFPKFMLKDHIFQISLTKVLDILRVVDNTKIMGAY
jgi:hypothetical protein